MLTATVAAWFKTRDRKCLIVGSVKERRLHFIFRNDICQIHTQVLIVVIVCVFPFSRSQRSSRWTLLLQTERCPLWFLFWDAVNKQTQAGAFVRTVAASTHEATHSSRIFLKLTADFPSCGCLGDPLLYLLPGHVSINGILHSHSLPLFSCWPGSWAKLNRVPPTSPLSLAVSVFSANRYQWLFLPDKVDNGRIRLDLWGFHFTSMGSKFIEIDGLFREVISFPAKS